VALVRLGQVALPPGAVSAGEVVDRDVVAAAIKRLWKEGGFSSKRVSLGVANQKVVVRQVDLLWMEPTELRKALSFQVQDYIPIPVDEAVLDFHPIEEFVNEDGARMVRVLLVAAARAMVTANLEAVTRAGLRPLTVDLTPFALIRSAVQAGGFDLETTATAIVDVGARVTNIVVHQNGVPRFVRILLMGGADFTDAVAERLGVPAEEAEQAKQQFAAPADPAARAADPTARVLDASTATFVEEIRGSLDYYRAAPGSAPIGRLLLAGGASLLSNLGQRLTEAIRLPVVPATPITTLRAGKAALSPEQIHDIEPLAGVCVGLALGAAS
jgi:type IV pilus assembly protein PilM